MFRKKQPVPEIIINGTALPEKYWKADIYGNTAIAKKGKEYAHVDEAGVLTTGTFVAGETSIDNLVLDYEKPHRKKQIIQADVVLNEGKIYVGRIPEAISKELYNNE